MNQKTKIQVLTLVILSVIFVLVLDYLGFMFFSFNYTHTISILLLILAVVGLFWLSSFIARQIFKKRKVIEYYFLTSFLAVIFYVAAWISVGVWKDLTGAACTGLFGVKTSCVEDQVFTLLAFPIFVITAPMLLIFLLIVLTGPVIAYAILGEKKSKHRTRKK